MPERPAASKPAMSSMPFPVSVAVLTCDRPHYLRECVRSVFLNAWRPLTIVISDDALTQASVDAIAELPVPEGVEIVHRAGPSAGSQACNARAAIEACGSEHVVFMHDDDTLTPGAIDLMAMAWRDHPGRVDAVYGRQHLIDAAGRINPVATQRNDAYYRKAEAPGPQESCLWCALTGQFPNDGMMIRRSLALEVGYPLESEVGSIPVDFHFGLRYAQAASGEFILLPQYTACYRVHRESVMHRRRRYNGHLGFEVLSGIPVENPREAAAKAAALDRFAASAVMGYLAARRSGDAARVLWNHGRRLDKAWSVRVALLGMVTFQRLGFPVSKLLREE
jgi:glycosyltransferase involved in cell wall biosynthesis